MQYCVPLPYSFKDKRHDATRPIHVFQKYLLNILLNRTIPNPYTARCMNVYRQKDYFANETARDAVYTAIFCSTGPRNVIYLSTQMTVSDTNKQDILFVDIIVMKILLKIRICKYLHLLMCFMRYQYHSIGSYS